MSKQKGAKGIEKNNWHEQIKVFESTPKSPCTLPLSE